MKFLVFLAGFVVMAVELLAGRLLIPLYGGSVDVWGAVIGFFLLSMSLGYWAGGVVADSRYGARALVPTLGLLGVSVLLLHPIRLVEWPFMILTAFLLTFLPGFLGGAVMPLALKHDAHSLKRLGNTAGTLSAWSTIGSVLGTFATIFVLLPYLGVLKSIVLLAIIAFLTASLLNRWFLFALVLMPFLFFSSPTDLPVTLESPYGPVEVYDKAGIRIMEVSGIEMSAMNISNPSQIVSGYDYLKCQGYSMDFMDSIFIIGIGAGSQTLDAHSRGMDVTAAEINPVVLGAAQDYFGVKEQERLQLIQGDGRAALASSDESYDVILMDAMNRNNGRVIIPPQLITQEFFTVVREHLKPGGVFTMHALNPPDGELVQNIRTTLETVFKNVHVLQCGSPVIVASDATIGNRPESTFYPLERGVVFTDDKIPIPLN